MRTLHARARAARLRAGFTTPQQAADAIGCSRPLVVAWESGAAKSIGSRYLLAAARAYKVRPEWLNLDADDDGYPWSPPGKKGSAAAAAHALSPDPDVLHEALTLLAYDEAQSGAYAPRARAVRLANLYERVAGDGGRLSREHDAGFVAEVEARRRKKR